MRIFAKSVIHEWTAWQCRMNNKSLPDLRNNLTMSLVYLCYSFRHNTYEIPIPIKRSGSHVRRNNERKFHARVSLLLAHQMSVLRLSFHRLSRVSSLRDRFFDHSPTILSVKRRLTRKRRRKNPFKSRRLTNLADTWLFEASTVFCGQFCSNARNSPRTVARGRISPDNIIGVHS